jgi:hypothetical protein
MFKEETWTSTFVDPIKEEEKDATTFLNIEVTIA